MPLFIVYRNYRKKKKNVSQVFFEQTDVKLNFNSEIYEKIF